MHFIKFSNICILNQATGFLIFLLTILIPGFMINSNTNAKTSSAKFSYFFLFICHMCNVVSSITLITITISNHELLLCTGFVNENVLRAVPGTRQASGRQILPQGVYREKKRCL